MKETFRWLSVILSLSVLLGAGCNPVSSIKDASLPSLVSSTPAIIPEPGPWRSVGAGIERNSFRFATTTGAEMMLYRFDAKQFDFSFEHATSVKRVSEWKDTLSNSVLVMNGVYFHEDDLPSGFFVHQGKRVGTRQFDLDKSGLIDLSSERMKLLQLTTSTQLTGLKEAAQSYPFLIQNGVSSLKSDSGKAARRTFVGLDREGRVYVGILPYAQMSLFELAKQLVSLPIAWDRVLNMDGGPSSGMAFSTKIFSETVDSYVAVPNVLLVRRKDMR